MLGGFFNILVVLCMKNEDDIIIYGRFHYKR